MGFSIINLLDKLSQFHDFEIKPRDQYGYFTIHAGGIKWALPILSEDGLFGALVAASANERLKYISEGRE